MGPTAQHHHSTVSARAPRVMARAQFAASMLAAARRDFAALHRRLLTENEIGGSLLVQNLREKLAASGDLSAHAVRRIRDCAEWALAAENDLDQAANVHAALYAHAAHR